MDRKGQFETLGGAARDHDVDKVLGEPVQHDPPRLGSYPIVIPQHSAPTLYQVCYHSQSLFFYSDDRIDPRPRQPPVARHPGPGHVAADLLHCNPTAVLANASVRQHQCRGLLAPGDSACYVYAGASGAWPKSATGMLQHRGHLAVVGDPAQQHVAPVVRHLLQLLLLAAHDVVLALALSDRYGVSLVPLELSME